MIKLGMPILYEYDSVLENVLLAKELGLDFIELNLNFGYCRKELESGKLLKLFKDNNLHATLHFYDEADFASYKEVVDAYLVLLERYAKLGEGLIDIVNVHMQSGPVVTISGIKNYIYNKEYNEQMSNLITNLSRAEAILTKYGIKMVIENTDTFQPFMMKNYEGLKANGFKFNFDIGHDNLSKDCLLQASKDYDLKFSEFHFHDANRKTCHLALGEGNLNLKFFKDMTIKNDAYVLLEVKDSNDLKKSVPYFKNL